MKNYKINTVTSLKEKKEKLIERKDYSEVNHHLWKKLKPIDFLEGEDSILNDVSFWIKQVPKEDIPIIFNSKFLLEKEKDSGNTVLHELIRNHCLEFIPMENLTLKHLVTSNGLLKVIDFLRIPLNGEEASKNWLDKLLQSPNFSVRKLKKAGSKILNKALEKNKDRVEKLN